MNNPTTEQVKELRESVQARHNSNKTAAVKRCSESIYCTPRAWTRYESGDRKMHPALFELAKIKQLKGWI